MEDTNIAQETTPNKSWTLEFGIHQGTVISRDSDSIGGFESLQACIDELAKKERFFNSIGYVIWYANAVSPSGERQSIHKGNSYSR